MHSWSLLSSTCLATQWRRVAFDQTWPRSLSTKNARFGILSTAGTGRRLCSMFLKFTPSQSRSYEWSASSCATYTSSVGDRWRRLHFIRRRQMDLTRPWMSRAVISGMSAQQLCPPGRAQLRAPCCMQWIFRPMMKWEGKAAPRPRHAHDFKFPTESHTRASSFGKLSAGILNPCDRAGWSPLVPTRTTGTAGQDNHHDYAQTDSSSSVPVSPAGHSESLPSTDSIGVT